jgi:hypothetical protein
VIRLYLYWATFTAMWLIIAVEARLMLRSRRVLTEGARHRAFFEWAKWTMITVTDKRAMVYAATLTQLYEDQVTEKVWDDPIAVALWHADPDLHTAYQREADACTERGEDCHG